MYACLGLSAIVFAIHGLFLHGWNMQNQRMSLDWMMLMAYFNLAGAVTYASRVCRDKAQQDIIMVLCAFDSNNLADTREVVPAKI